MSRRISILERSGRGLRTVVDAGFPYPDLLVVGSALPKVGGVELLGYLRGELGVRIPVVIFSTTLSPLEMRRVMELGQADYFVRPDVFSVLLEEVQGIQQSWLESGGRVAKH